MRRPTNTPRHPGQRERRCLRRLLGSRSEFFDSLEDRCLLATFPVTTTADNGNNLLPTPGSLRAAILAANAATGADDITFQLTGGPAPFTISPPTALPSITDQVNIDATTQSQFAGTPVVVLNGAGAGGGANGFVINFGGDGSTIRGFVINQFSANGILVGNAAGNTIAGNYIGTDATGTQAVDANGTSWGNGSDGILLSLNANGNTIGGTGTGDGNLISNNSSVGLEVRADSNTIQGNLVGLNAAGNAALGNGQAGIVVGSQQGNLIGGTTMAARNVVSGNGAMGIFFQNSGTASLPGNNLIQGNYIGTDINGMVAVPNTLDGVFLQNSVGNTVGGLTAAEGNLISGNGLGSGPTGVAGIFLNGAGTQDNQILNNLIGTDATGTAALGGVPTTRPHHGIVIFDAANNIIGGSFSSGVTPTGNTIAFNSGVGVYLQIGSGTGSAVGNSIFGNTITFNGEQGIWLQQASAQSLSTVIVSNTITHNAGNGVWLLRASSNQVLSNTITDNGNNGVNVDGGAFNSILSNMIFANAGLNILLSNNGNNNQPAPVLINATSSGGSTTIRGTIQGEPLTPYRLQFFSSASSPPPGFGAGETLIGDTGFDTSVTTDSAGNATFNITLPVTVNPDQFLTATATSLETLNTSQFARTSPNLVVVKTAAPEPVFQTQNLTYTITITNQGASPTPGITLIDTLPAGVTFISASGSVTPIGNTLTVPIGTLNRGESETYTIVVRADAAGTLTNTATLTIANESDNPDLNPADNTSSVNSTVVPVADLAVSKAADLATVAQFENLTYTIDVANHGPSPASGVTVTDTLPAGATVVSAPSGASPAGGTLTIPVGTLAPGEVRSFTVVVQLSNLGANVNNVQVTSRTADLNPDNDRASVATNVLLSFVVTNTNDSGPGSLRQAILNVNSDTNNPLPDMITFRFPANQQLLITLASPLPVIMHPLILDGTPLAGLSGTAALTIDGSALPTTVKPEAIAQSPALLVVAARDTTIAGLTLRGYDGFGIKLDVGSGGVTLANNRIIGFDPSTSGGNPPRRLGGVLVLSDHNTIGGADLQAGNVISGDGYGIYLAGQGASANQLIGNFLGVDRDGNALATGAAKIDGIEVDGASGNLIGPRNTIVNYLTGIYLFGGSTFNQIRGNTIRSTADAPVGDPNVENGGILATNASDNFIGGLTAADGNTIQNVRGSGVVLFNGATRNIVSFNTITGGTGAGVYLFDAPNNRVGVAGAGNTITGNDGSGVQLQGTMTTGNLVQANLIAQNNQDGVYLFGASNNTIGGAATGEGNNIRNNAFSGVHVQAQLAQNLPATGNFIIGNTIVGPPTVFGVLFEDGATQNTVGGAGGAANTFVGNGSRDIQVLINGVPPSGPDQTGGNFILANNFGTSSGVAVMSRRLARRTRTRRPARQHVHPLGGNGHGHRQPHHPIGPRLLVEHAGRGRI